MTKKDELSAQQQWAIELLTTGHRASDTSKKLGVAKSTISKWKKKPAFRRALAEAQSEAVETAFHIFTSKVDAAANVVTEHIDGNKNNKLQLEAARLLLDRVGLAGPQERDTPIDEKEAGARIARLYGLDKDEPASEAEADADTGDNVVALHSTDA